MSKINPKVSIAIPIHPMENWQFFLTRCLESIYSQTFIDYEIVITNAGKMAENTNRAIGASNGELIKILYMDDYFARPNALREIVDNFGESDNWLVAGCLHQEQGGVPKNPHYPSYNENISQGNNTIGSPSILTIRNKGHLLFDENLSWLLDCELYSRYYKKYGEPKILNDLNVILGIGTHQMTNILSNEDKQKEFNYLNR